MTSSKVLAVLGVTAAVAASAAAAGCGGNTATSATVAQPAHGQGATIAVASEGNLGKILVNSGGQTVYLFQKDGRDQSACAGACAAAWPPVRSDGKPVIGAGVKPSLVGTVKRSDGKPQVTYDGHPLYLFQGDHASGQTNGQGIAAFGAKWFALSGAGSAVTTASSNAGGGNVY